MFIPHMQWMPISHVVNPMSSSCQTWGWWPCDHGRDGTMMLSAPTRPRPCFMNFLRLGHCLIILIMVFLVFLDMDKTHPTKTMYTDMFEMSLSLSLYLSRMFGAYRSVKTSRVLVMWKIPTSRSSKVDVSWSMVPRNWWKLTICAIWQSAKMRPNVV